MGLIDEILEQPAVLARLLDDQGEAVARITRSLAGTGIRYVYLAARGTSDNAGIYAKYTWESLGRVPVALAAPSLFSVYRRPPNLAHAWVVGISQSGQSPDIVAVLSEASRQGSPTLAITNSPDSPLAAAADSVIDIAAGAERSVAATKTYTAELMAIAMLAAGLSGDPRDVEQLAAVPDWVRQALELDPPVSRLAERHRFMDRCVVLGRGYDYATAHEWALKLKELAQVAASSYSTSDFQHGPMALLEPGSPVFVTLPAGPAADVAADFFRAMVVERGVDLTAISNDESILALAQAPLGLPAEIPEWLSPLVSIIPAQLFCLRLAEAKGLDPHLPRGLTKVTRTV
jgi:glutamine---fructose-6-phosphate transaminase (isomerizing)